MNALDDDPTYALWLAAEDYAGLWEFVWELRPHHRGECGGELRARATNVLSELITRGWVELVRHEEPTEEITPLPADQWAAELARDANWTVPAPDGTSVRVSATALGEAQVFRAGRS